MANEAKKILEHYLFRNDDNLSFNVDLFGISIEECHSILNDWHSFDRPDIYSSDDKKIYGLEYFEYDAYRHNRRGSQSSKEQSEINQSIKAKIHEKFKFQNTVTSFRSMNSKPSEKYYKDNFTKYFKEHYAKVDKYREHIVNELKIDRNDIHIWFIAEDTTPLGTYFVCRNKSNQGQEPAFPIFFPEIEKLFLESTEIEGIIFADNCNKILSLVKRNAESTKVIKEQHYYRGESLFFFEPKFASTAIKIPSIEE